MSWQPHPDIGFQSKAEWQGISKAPIGVPILQWRPDWEKPRWIIWNGNTDDVDAPKYWYPVPPLPVI